MRTSLVPVLAALVSLASTLPTGYSAHPGRVVARDPTKARSPRAAPPDLQQRNVPRAAPSAAPHVARAAPSHVARAASVPSAAHVPRAAPAGPSSHPARRDAQPQYVPRAEPSGHVKRSQQGQNVFGEIAGLVVGWLDKDKNADKDMDQCPAPLSACPVRGARDPDAYECVDLESDLYSCGGCAADDIAYVGTP